MNFDAMTVDELIEGIRAEQQAHTERLAAIADLEKRQESLRMEIMIIQGKCTAFDRDGPQLISRLHAAI